jgi:RNA polymerase sigma-70 factor (ECF subfamily)
LISQKDLPTYNESEIVESLKNGNVDALKFIMDLYQNNIFNTAYRMIGSYEDALEVTQDIFFNLFRYIKNFRGKSSLLTYIYRIALNMSKDRIKALSRRKNRLTFSIDEEDAETKMKTELIDSNPGQDIKIQEKEFLNTLELKLGELSIEYKQVIVMRYVDELSYEEIADILNCSIGTVKSRLNRARSELKKRMRKYLL